jgi:hypothetical protein
LGRILANIRPFSAAARGDARPTRPFHGQGFVFIDNLILGGANLKAIAE